MIDLDPVVLSRLQFALTAMYHFLFVPLTLGLSLILAIMESVYVMTGRVIWKEMTQFWGKLFGINFALGVATGITMEFQFGTNWSYYSHYVGDIFGAPLAIEGLMAFFLESTFVGLFFFGWNRMSKLGHLSATWLVAIGSNLSALWILVANGWMQNPVGSTFNPETMRMELTGFADILLNPVAQSKFVHTVSAGYVAGSMFVLALSSWYLLKGRHIQFARRSFTVAASFGLASALSVVVLGDESGYTLNDHQKMKLAAIEGMWETEPAPASFALFGLPDQEAQLNRFEVKIPWLMGLLATRSFDTEIPGLKDLAAVNEHRINDGLVAYNALMALRQDKTDDDARQTLQQHQESLGYALLLKRYLDDPGAATPEQISQAAQDTIPHVPSLFWSFRLMVALGLYFIVLFATAFWFASRHTFEKRRWFLKLAFFSLPLPWLAAELGWFVAEHGRQPWSIEGVLPTALSASSLSGGQILLTLAGFVLLYSALAAVEVFLLVRYAKLGPVKALGLSNTSAAE